MILKLIIQFVSSFAAIFAFSTVFQCPKGEFVFCGLVGGIGWSVYYYLFNFQNQNANVSLFFSVVTIAILSRILAVKRKVPMTVFIAAGILPTVPGAGIYKTMYALITHESEKAMQYGIETILASGIIALGIFLILALPHNLFKVLEK